MANLLPHTRSATAFYVGRASDGLVVMLFAGVCFAIYVCFGNERFYQENALFELGQNVLLFFGVAAFCVATSLSQEKTCQAIMWGLTLFCVSMLFREIDVRGTNLEPYLSTIFEHRIHYGVLLLFWIGLLFMVAREMGETLKKMVNWLFSQPGAWLVVGVVFYIIGDMAEKNLFTSNDGLAKMVEETAELLGTLFIFYAGYVSVRRQARLTTSQQTPSQDDAR